MSSPPDEKKSMEVDMLKCRLAAANDEIERLRKLIPPSLPHVVKEDRLHVWKMQDFKNVEVLNQVLEMIENTDNVCGWDALTPCCDVCGCNFDLNADSGCWINERSTTFIAYTCPFHTPK